MKPSSTTTDNRDLAAEVSMLEARVEALKRKLEGALLTSEQWERCYRIALAERDLARAEAERGK